ncbi:hypothetical protein EON82_18645 [bacterium]|nr:MAG: hypothetical protein EON82_18645 [bacterium]
MKPKVLDGLVLAYGLLLIALGVIGYLISGSVVSLAAGGGAGVLVLIFLAITAKKRQIGRIGVAVLSLLMLGNFGVKAIKSLSAAPTTGNTTPVWHVWTLAIASLIVFVALGLGHMSAMKERRLE